MTLGALDDFWRSNDEWIAAVVTMVLAFALAYVVDHAFQRRSERMASQAVNFAIPKSQVESFAPSRSEPRPR